MNNYFEELEYELNSLESQLAIKGLPKSCHINDLESLINILESLIETANKVYERVS